MEEVESLSERSLPVGLLRPLQEPLRQVVHDGGLRESHEGSVLQATSEHPQRVNAMGALGRGLGRSDTGSLEQVSEPQMQQG